MDRKPERQAGEATTDAPRAAAPSSRELVPLAVAGDPVAAGLLLRGLAREMEQVVRSVLGPATSDVEDALQQALVGVVKALPGFRGDCSVEGFACRIAFRTALRHRRSLRMNRARIDDLDDVEPESQDAPLPEASDARRRTELLRRMLDELPDEQAEALALRSMLGWSLDEIATVTETPVNTVRSRLRLAKSALRRRVEADPELAERLGVEVC